MTIPHSYQQEAREEQRLEKKVRATSNRAKRIKRPLSLLVLMTAAAVSLTACGGGGEKSSSGAKKGGEFTIGVMMNTADNPYIQSMIKSNRAECAKLKFNCIELDGQGDAATQANQVDTMISRGVDGILFFPADVNAVTPMLTKLKAAEIPVVSYGNRVLEGDLPLITAAVDENSHQQGFTIGDQVCKDAHGAAWKVGMIGGVSGGYTATQRAAGFEEALTKNCPSVKVVASQPADFDRAKALSAAEDMLQAHADLNAIYSHDDNMAIGARDAVKAAGRASRVSIYGIGGMGEYLDLLAQGKVRATVFQSPVKFGTTPVETMAKILRGEKVEKFVFFDSPLVTKENAATIPREW